MQLTLQLDSAWANALLVLVCGFGKSSDGRVSDRRCSVQGRCVAGCCLREVLVLRRGLGSSSAACVDGANVWWKLLG